jgi:fatty-acyl-CoA synthase
MYNTHELILLGSYLPDDELNRRRENISCHDVVNMQYTSGTTGFPKGVMLSHHNIVNCGQSTGDCMNYTQSDRLLVCVPLFHCFGCVLAMCAVITHGCAMVFVEEFDPLMVLASVQKEKCTALYGVPTMFIAELNHPMFSMFDLSSLRTGIMAGSLCPIETMNQVMSRMNCRDLIIVYGLTESSPGMTATRISDSAEVRATTVGTNYPGVEVKIFDPETGEECPPEVTSQAIDKNGWLHSGDLAVKTSEGFYRITGRIKDMIIRGGENIYPREIENFLYQLPQIEMVEVAGIADKKYGEIVAAFIKLKSGQQITQEEIQEFCRGKISRIKIPKHVIFVDDFPKTASGKIQKYKLRQMGLEYVQELNA